MHRCKTIYPAKGWLRVVWGKDVASDIDRLCLQACVNEIPGIKLYPTALEVPYTAWMLPEVAGLLGRLDALIPPPETINVTTLPREWGARTLYEHQLDGVDFILDHRGVVLADEMGVGKTSTAIVGASFYAQRYAPRPVLIIGTKAVQQTWRRELQALGQVKEPIDYCALESGNLDDKSFWKGAKWYFVHYEIVKAWWSLIYQQRPCVVIIDEAHYIKNGEAQRSKGAALAVSGSHQRIALTGTPIENRPSDLWNLLNVVCGPKTWGYPSDFRRRYCGAVHNGYRLEDGAPTNVSELRQRLSAVYLRRSTQDAGIELPTFTRTTQHCDLGKFKGEYDGIVSAIENFELGTLPSLVKAIAEGLAEKMLPELTRLRQLTSRAKVSATRDYTINALEQGESILVFAWEREAATQIFNGLGGYPKILAHGGVSQKLRDAAIDEFQGGKEPTAFITTFGAMAEGVTLHKARICIMHDLDWTLKSMLQAEKRMHRIGQTQKCLSVWMLAEGSMDTLIAPILLKKATLIEEILGLRHDIQDDVGLTELAGRTDADALVAQAFAAWSR